MEFGKIDQLPALNKAGRPMSYPFDKLQPNEKLTINAEGLPLKQKRLAVANSLNYYKKQNSLYWFTIVKIEGSDIVVYRIS